MYGILNASLPKTYSTVPTHLMKQYNFFPTLPKSWNTLLKPVFHSEEIQQLASFLIQETAQNKNILPQKDEWFAALEATPFEKVKVIILGQDPYPTIGHGHGLCFSVRPDVMPLPKSLQNINKELLSDLDIDNTQSGNLLPWANQGVLLLNAVLTVEAGKTNSHQNKGWETFTDFIIEKLNTEKTNLVFVLWGAYAQKKGRFIDTKKHFVINSPHPSPLSAYKGFFNSQPFSKTNDYLKANNLIPIDWHC